MPRKTEKILAEVIGETFQTFQNELSIVSQIKIRRGSALRLPWATARDRPYHETLSELL